MRDSAEMLKEQLRTQGKEMQRREAEQAKNDAKIKHILKISQEKIEDLEFTLKQKLQGLNPLCFIKKNIEVKENEG